MYEVTKYILDGGPNGELWAGPLSIVMNEKVWSDLPPEAKEAFNKFGGKSGAQMMLDAFFASGEKAKKLVESKGVIINNLSPEEFERWSKIAEKVWDDSAKKLEAKGLPAQAVLDEVISFRQKYSK